MRMDREYATCTFVTVGLELSWQQGGGMSVSGAAALAVRGEGWRPQWRVHARVGKAAQLPETGREESVVRVESVGAALAEINRHVTQTPHVVVARRGGMEAAFFREYQASCPRLASLSMWDAMRLARIVCPTVSEPSEAVLAETLGVRLPGLGASLTQEVRATSEVCRRGVERGAATGRWSSLSHVGDLVSMRSRLVVGMEPVQERLFG